MYRTYGNVGAIVCLLGSILPISACAGTHNPALDIGDQAPAFENLIGIDNKKHSLSDLKEAQAVVVVFTCNHCPVARAYEQRLIQFTKQFKDKGVALVAINVNNIPADRLDKMQERAQEMGFNFMYLYDSTQKIGRAYGASVTPHCFVLDGQRRIAYMGAFDDNQRESKAKNHYVREAVESILAGRKPKVNETRQFGCTIKYEDA